MTYLGRPVAHGLAAAGRPSFPLCARQGPRPQGSDELTVQCRVCLRKLVASRQCLKLHVATQSLQ